MDRVIETLTPAQARENRAQPGRTPHSWLDKIESESAMCDCGHAGGAKRARWLRTQLERLNRN